MVEIIFFNYDETIDFLDSVVRDLDERAKQARQAEADYWAWLYDEEESEGE
jgi:hypothetical protein